MLDASHRYFHKTADVLDLVPTVREVVLAPARVIKAPDRQQKRVASYAV